MIFTSLFSRSRVVGGVKTFISDIKDVISQVKLLTGNIANGGIGDMFTELIDAVKNLPERIGNVGEFLLKFAKKVASYEGYAG